MSYDESRDRLQELAGWHVAHAGDRNEATTRLHLIDQIFLACLSWAREDLVLEERFDGQYADYVLYAPRRLLIVEAKREGDYFEIPAGEARLERSLPTLCHDYPQLKAALEQVASYCQARGVPLGCVSNGHQLVAFVATRNDGTPPLDGRAIVFGSLQQMLDHFLELWQSLSKPGVLEGHLQTRLLSQTCRPIPAPLSTAIPHYPGIQRRNSFQTELQILSELILEDVGRTRELEPRFLAETYCESGALSQYALTTKAILRTRYAALFDADQPAPTIMPATTKDGVSPELLAESLGRRPILLLGDVGVGKTMFIRHLVKVDAASLFTDAIALYLDFGSKGAFTNDLFTFVSEDLVRQMTADHHVDILERNFVRGVYDLDLQAFRRGIYSDLVEKAPELFLQKEIAFLESKVTSIVSHIQASLTHIAKGRRKQLVIFLDNADQRDEETQQRVFLMAQEFADHWPMLVFVALRPETFYRSHQFGALSGYHPKAFTISPPRVDRVLETRLNFALKITTGTIPVQHIAGLGTRLETLNDLIHVFLNSLRENKNLAVCIDNVSGGNIRLALDLVRQFFGSGHVDTEKIWGLYKLPDGYIIPLHEFLRAIIYGDTRFFDPSRSPIANLFRISTPDPREHFLGPLTLAAASNLANTEGFADTYAVYDLLQGYGFTGNQVDAAVANCVKKHLLETTARRIPQPGQALPSLVRTTTVGEYHLQFLLPSFVFMDAVVVDTPVLDEAFRAQIHNVEDIADRLSRCEVFRHYLDSCWQSFSTPPSVFSWPERSALIANEVSRISRRVEENRRRPSSTR